ncbi:Rpn family recombination-promoting nuclease/putative transposase [Lamprobacter modestohalophilus]|uniref:Rpn family recombination-promoting nuclease/putative transposase n=1 Tax=Lamprobacter modestohalophilus TaxID=1064514 RepID=UPI002ADED36B|nr:Rpn family recombination-promoting nuclease/putative transposase [Lamprobacter modestohalophilus]MCF8014616.1 Rpn family recombination-promoting nuclease/putative transposase [Chromatiaceae bacterium]MEA1050993.1 Rpn family recombination-promoting nuclease/putative transposase [Lamprobacter modestohalophilus]
MESINNPHDSFFRESFGRREITQDFLLHHLPDTLRAAYSDNVTTAALHQPARRGVSQTVSESKFLPPVYPLVSPSVFSRRPCASANH